jgi:hypothetical protein
MDYFFVGGRFENFVGLNDLFLKLRYDNNKKWFVQTDVHSFSTNANVYKGTELQSSQLGTEIDLSGGVVLNDDVSFQIGYSQMLASSTLKYMQTLTAAENQNWMYVMLIIRPKSDKKFIGILN